jgi:hypothetical protein
MTSVLAPTAEELSEMSPAQKAERLRAMEANVFGADCKRDKNGKPMEQGIGSPGNINDNHLAALAKEKKDRDLNEAILNSVKRA